MLTKDKLKAAAEELVKAAYLDCNTESNKETINTLITVRREVRGGVCPLHCSGAV
jgi:hypothetical protein